MENKNKAFTLTELLLSLGIVGVLAVMVIPSLVGHVYNRVYSNQIKSMSSTIENLAQDELLTKATRDMSITDFKSASTLLTTKHFSISKKCSASSALKDCWNTTAASGKKQSKYKTLKGKASSITNPGDTVILTNGVMFGYTPVDNGGKTTGYVIMDVNGVDGPNIYGRDVFAFYVTSKGYVDDEVLNDSDVSVETKIADCKKGNALRCFGALKDNSWKMDY